MAEQVKGIVRRSTRRRSRDRDSIHLEESDTEMEMQEFAKGSESSRLGVLVVGKTGTGKSCLINNIFAENVAEVGGTLKSETKGIVEYKGEVRGSGVIVYDTQGLEDTESDSDGEILEKLKGLITSDKIHLTVFCTSMTNVRFDQKRTFVEFHKIGLKWEDTIFALTFADKFHEPQKPKANREEVFRKKVEEWRGEIQDHLKKDVGLSPEVADKIAVYPTTYDYNVPLPSNEKWFTPLWLAILKVLPNNSVLSFMSMSFEKEQKEQDVGLQEREGQQLDQRPQDQRPQDQRPQDQQPQDQPPQDQRPQDQRPQDQQETENQPHPRPNIDVDEQTLWEIIKEKFGAARKKVWGWIQHHILRREPTNPDEEQPDINA